MYLTKGRVHFNIRKFEKYSYSTSFIVVNFYVISFFRKFKNYTNDFFYQENRNESIVDSWTI